MPTDSLVPGWEIPAGSASSVPWAVAHNVPPDLPAGGLPNQAGAPARAEGLEYPWGAPLGPGSDMDHWIALDAGIEARSGVLGFTGLSGPSGAFWGSLEWAWTIMGLDRLAWNGQIDTEIGL